MWSGRQKAIEALQAESYAALIPDFGNSINWDSAQNVFIDGDNLEVLKLLQNAYNDKIKMIYIDPPYNTGKDFVYNDDFSDPKRRYLEVTGQVDAEGNRLTSNAETSGRKHSNWLTMMYPRLVLARNLLTEDGFLIVSIGEDEISNLRHMLNDVMGAENLMAQVTLITGAGQAGEGVEIQKNVEYVLVYARNSAMAEVNRVDDVNESWRSLTDAPTGLITRPEMGYTVYWHKHSGDMQVKFDYDKSKINQNTIEKVYKDDKDLLSNGFVPIRPGYRNGNLHRWRWGSETFLRRIDEIEVRIVNGKPGLYFLQRGTIPPKNVWSFGSGTAELKELFDGSQLFDYPKSTAFLKYVVSLFTDESSIVLDFFAGSGTLGHSVELQNESDGGNRRYICVTLPEPTNKDSDARKAGIEKVSEITEMRLKKVLDLFDGAKERGLRILRLGPSAFKPHFPSDDSLFVLDESSLEMDPNTEQIAGEVLLRQGVTLDQPWTRVSGIQSGSVKVCDLFGTMEIEQILETEASVLVFLEDSFKGRDALKSELSFAIAQAGKKMVTY